MNKAEAKDQLYRLSLDWGDEGLNTKLNQTDINAIGIVCSELDIVYDKLKKIEKYLINYIEVEPEEGNPYAVKAEFKEILKIIKGDEDK